MYRSRQAAQIQKITVLDRIKNNWFLIALVFCIWLAKVNPAIGSTGGFLKPEVTVKYFAVSGIFFLSGLSIKTEELAKAFVRVRLHLLVQCFTFIFIPCFMQLFTTFLELFYVNEWILKGLVTVSCMPPPVSSAVILTKAVGGNEAAAVFNSAFGSFLGIILTPLLLLCFLGISTTIPLSSTLAQLSLTVILPLLLGQTVRQYIKDILERRGSSFSGVGSLMLLFIIYTTFCDTFHENLGLEPSSLFGIIFIVGFIQITFLSILFLFTTRRRSRFTTKDVVAVLFSATHKSLTLGMPMLKILYTGLPNLSVISIPLLVYHPMQILLGGLLVPYIQNWMLQTQTRNFWHYTRV